MATISLTAKIRDFQASHPDFENRRGPAETGLVRHVLGADKKPVFNRDRPVESSGVSSEASFNQWFRTIDGINLETDFIITLDNGQSESGGIYKASHDPFFPIDKALFGNICQELFQRNSSGQFTTTLTPIGQQLRDKKNRNPNQSDRFNITQPDEYVNRAQDKQDHNYHFTLETSARFTYRGDEEFTVKGDDDIWVFLGNSAQGNLLVIDLGGVHAPSVGSLDLRLSNPKNRADQPSNRLLLFLKEDLGIASAPLRTPLELNVGQTYDFFFFSAERHTFGSMLYIETSLALKPLRNQELETSAQPRPQVQLEARQAVQLEVTQHAKEPLLPGAGNSLQAAVQGEFKVSLMGGAVAPPGGLRIPYRLLPSTAQWASDYLLDHEIITKDRDGKPVEPEKRELSIPGGSSDGFIQVNPLENRLRAAGAEPQEKSVTIQLLPLEDPSFCLGDQAEATVYINPSPATEQRRSLKAQSVQRIVVGEFKISLMADAVAPPQGLKVQYFLDPTESPYITAIREADYTLFPAAQDGVEIAQDENAEVIKVFKLVASGSGSINGQRKQVVARLNGTFTGCAYELGDQVKAAVFIT